MIYIGILYVLIVILMVSVIAFIISNINISSKEFNRKLFNDNKTVEIDELALQLLDALIVECHTEYVTLNYFDKDYISKTQEIDIVRDVSDMVHRRISPILLDKLSVVYSKYVIGEIIGNKVYFFNMNYVITKNNVLPKK